MRKTLLMLAALVVGGQAIVQANSSQYYIAFNDRGRAACIPNTSGQTYAPGTTCHFYELYWVGAPFNVSQLPQPPVSQELSGSFWYTYASPNQINIEFTQGGGSISDSIFSLTNNTWNLLATNNYSLAY